jgi:hypothetical protein
MSENAVPPNTYALHQSHRFKRFSNLVRVCCISSQLIACVGVGEWDTYTTLRYNTLHYATTHYTTLQHTTLRYNALHYPTAILAYRISPIFTFIFIFTASFTTQPYPCPSPDLPTAHSLISAPTAISSSSPHHLTFLPCHITSSQQLLDGAARLHFAICLTMKRRVCM